MGSFPHQGNLESKTKFPNPHQETLCLSIMCVCWLDTARHATVQWLRMRSGSARLLFRTLLVSCRLGLPAPRLWNFRIENYIFQTSLLLALWSPGPRLRSTLPGNLKSKSKFPALPPDLPKNPSPPTVGHRPSRGRHSIVQWFRARAQVQRSLFQFSIPTGVMPLRVASPRRVFHRDSPFPTKPCKFRIEN